MGKRTGNPTGRPTKLTKEAEDEMVRAVEAGMPFVIACDLVGVCRKTLNNWRTKGQEDIDEGKVTDAARFLRRFRRARAIQVREDLEVLNSSKDPVWTDTGDEDGRGAGRPMFLPESALSARKFKLASRFPELFGKNRTELSGPNGGPIQIDQDLARAKRFFELMTDEERAEAIETGKLPPTLGEE